MALDDKIPDTEKMLSVHIPLLAAKNLQDWLAGELQWIGDQEGTEPHLQEQLEFVFNQLQGTQTFRCGKCSNCQRVETASTAIFHGVATAIENRVSFQQMKEAWDKMIVEFPCTAR